MKGLYSHELEPEQPDSLPKSAFPVTVGISERPETLLVVDDDPMLCDLETEILRMEGYAVLEAQGAAEALRLAHDTPAIHLLIADFSMPDLDGFHLTRRFWAVHPKTPVLMVSSSLPLWRCGFPDVDRFDLLPKPFEFDELLHKVRILLDAAVPLPSRELLCHG